MPLHFCAVFSNTPEFSQGGDRRVPQIMSASFAQWAASSKTCSCAVLQTLRWKLEVWIRLPVGVVNTSASGLRSTNCSKWAAKRGNSFWRCVVCSFWPFRCS